jgi:hypothetical protein
MLSPSLCFTTSETREGRPLLTVETEVNGDSYAMKGVLFHGWFVGLVVPVQEIFFPALAALVGPVFYIIFSPHHRQFLFI